MEDKITPNAADQTAPEKAGAVAPESAGKIAREIAGTTEPKRQRIRLLNVPIDIIEPRELDLAIFELAKWPGEQRIVLLSLWDLLRARRNAEYMEYLDQAALIVPISKSIVAGARFLLKKQPTRYMPFDFVIKCLSVLEEHEFSCYLLGGKKATLAKIENNIATTFPGLQIVGRFPGPIKRRNEGPVIEVIRKSSPSLLLVNKGVRGGEMWIARNAGRLGSGIKLWCSDLFEVLAGRKWRPPRKIFELGLEWVGYCLRNPAKLLRIFPFVYYNFLLLAYKALKKK